MGGLQPWHWLIVIVFLLIVVCIVAGIVLVIVRAVSKPKAPGVGVGGTAPGWYPDPQDPTALRYFDGKQWVTGKQPPSS